MREFMNSLMNYYNTNAKFHSFVVFVEMGAVSFATSYSGGLPTTKAGWVALVFAGGGAVWGAIKRWLSTNVATENLTLKS